MARPSGPRGRQAPRSRVPTPRGGKSPSAPPRSYGGPGALGAIAWRLPSLRGMFHK